MDYSEIQQAFESLIDWLIDSEPEAVTEYIGKIRSDNPQLTNKQISEIIVNEQSLNSALLGALTGLGGLITLPATVPVDIIKAWKIQAFTIKCIASVYNRTTQNTDLKTDIILVSSSSSLEELKNLVLQEALKAAPKHALKAVEALKKTAIKEVGKAAPKYAAKALTKYGGKAIVKYSTKGVSKHLVKVFWKVGGKKVVEKTLQKTIGKAVPVVGAVVGGSIDWLATKAVGKLAIEYYENSVSEWVDEVNSLCIQNTSG